MESLRGQAEGPCFRDLSPAGPAHRDRRPRNPLGRRTGTEGEVVDLAPDSFHTAQQVEQVLRSLGVEHFLYLQIPHGYAHIDSIISFVAEKKAVIDPARLPRNVGAELEKRGFNLLEAPSPQETQELALNFVSLEPGSIMMASGFPETRKFLEDNGIQVSEIDITELRKGWGSLHCLTAALKGHGEIAVGNIIGADVFNILWILGASAAANPITISRRTLHFSFPWMLLIVIAMLGFMRMGYRVGRFKGVTLLVLYAIYGVMAAKIFY